MIIAEKVEKEITDGDEEMSAVSQDLTSDSDNGDDGGDRKLVKEKLQMLFSVQSSSLSPPLSISLLISPPLSLSVCLSLSLSLYIYIYLQISI